MDKTEPPEIQTQDTTQREWGEIKNTIHQGLKERLGHEYRQKMNQNGKNKRNNGSQNKKGRGGDCNNN